MFFTYPALSAGIRILYNNLPGTVFIQYTLGAKIVTDAASLAPLLLYLDSGILLLTHFVHLRLKYLSVGSLLY